MVLGFGGKILRVDLSSGLITLDQPDELFYRRYLGGRGFIAYYLLAEVPPRIDAYDPANKLIFANGPITGAPLGGSGRNSVGAQSPLTGAYGEAEVGGYWGAELKRAGWDGIVVEGKADGPVYLSIRDGDVQIRDARHLWNRATGDVEASIREELGDRLTRVAQTGRAGQNMVRYACVLNDLNHAAGRAGMGAVMGAKNLLAVAVRGSAGVKVAEPDRVKAMARWLAENYMNTSRGMHDLGTAGGLLGLNAAGMLPTRNFRSGVFEGADRISGEAMRDSIFVRSDTCFACPIRCKRVVEVNGPYKVEPKYGGPEYETVAAFGSNCGVDDIRAIAKANELCGAYGLDTIATGNVIAFAMECFEEGLLTAGEADGLELRFGNAGAVVALVEKIAGREGIGDVLAEGVMRAARQIGRGSEEFAVHVKGQEAPMHEPRLKQGMGLGYALNPTGAEHMSSIHDDMFEREGGSLRKARAVMGPLSPMPPTYLGPEKVRLFTYQQHWRSALNCLGICVFMPYSYEQTAEIVQGVTGWNTTVFELMKAGERMTTMARAYNALAGMTPQDDWLPERYFEPLTEGPTNGKAVDRSEFRRALNLYYEMMGYDAETGMPLTAKLGELDIPWVADALRQS